MTKRVVAGLNLRIIPLATSSQTSHQRLSTWARCGSISKIPALRIRRGSANDYWSLSASVELQQENLRFCGNYDATNSSILTLTDYGVSAGLATSGRDLAEQTGVYLLCQRPGNAISLDNLNGKAHTEGDWIVAINGTGCRVAKAEAALAGEAISPERSAGR